MRGSILRCCGLALLASVWSPEYVGGQVFGSPAALNSNAATDTGTDVTPQIVTDRAGLWIAAWAGSAGDVLYSRSTDDGATWTPLAAINPTPATRGGGVQLATDGAGTWVAVWAAGAFPVTDVDILTSRSLDGGGTWTPPVALNTNAATDSGLDLDPQVTTDGAGIWIVVWASNDSLGGTIGTDYDILFARSVDGGVTWTPPAPLNTNAAGDVGNDREPQLTTDGAGTWIAVWRSNSLGGTFGTDDDILLARSNDGGVTWTPPSPLNSNAASDSGDDYSPQLTTDGHGTWVAVWASTDSLGGTIGTDADILTARSVDGGVTWTPPAALNTDASTDVGDDAEPQLTTDGHGEWVAIWYGATLGSKTRRTDDDIRIAESRDGGLSWSQPIPLNNNATHDRGFESDPQLATDGAGTWLAAWDTQDSLGGTIGKDFDIVVARGTDVRCPAAPQPGCVTAIGHHTSTLLLRDVTHGTDLLRWSWSAQQAGDVAAFGNPASGDVLTGNNYRFCIYDGASALILSAVGAAGGVCGRTPCWKAEDGKGFTYNDRERTPDGLDKIRLTAGTNQTNLLVKGKGSYLHMPALGSVLLPLRAQLQAGNSACWEATFSMPTMNDGREFRSRGD